MSEELKKILSDIEKDKETEKLNNIIKELELDNCRLRNSDEILNNVIEEKDKEIERLKKELEIEKDISDGMLETIDKAIELIEKDYIYIQHDTYNKLLKILKKEENNEIKSS